MFGITNKLLNCFFAEKEVYKEIETKELSEPIKEISRYGDFGKYLFCGECEWVAMYPTGHAEVCPKCGGSKLSRVIGRWEYQPKSYAFGSVDIKTNFIRRKP